jgi:hypothetical protein
VLDAVIGLADSVERAVGAGRISRAAADRWVREQRARDVKGEFHSELSKVLVVGEKREALGRQPDAAIGSGILTSK